MSKDLPKMYVNKIKKELHNNQNLFSSYEQNDGINNMPIAKKGVINLKSKYQIEQKIYNILNPSKYVYKADVHIAFKDGSLKEAGSYQQLVDEGAFFKQLLKGTS